MILDFLRKLFKKKEEKGRQSLNNINYHGQNNTIANLIKEAEKYYPNGDRKKALTFFKEAIKLAPDATDFQSDWEAIDMGDIGFACWATFVCEDEMEDEEFKELLNLIGKKSPISALKIKQAILEHQKSLERNGKLLNLEKKIIQIASQENPDLDSFKGYLNNFRELCEIEKQWWRLRDLANSLTKMPISKDFAWSLYNQSLYIRSNLGGGLATIYAPMAYLRKKEKDFYHAIKLFIMAYSENQSANYTNQIRICLKKMGVKDNPDKIKDNLIQMITQQGPKKAIEKLESLKNK